VLSDLADLMFPGYEVARHPDASHHVVLLHHGNGERNYMQQMHSDLVSSRHIELRTHANGARELPFNIQLILDLAAGVNWVQLMLDLAAGVNWRDLDGGLQRDLDLELVLPSHALVALDQLPELVEHSDDEEIMPELEPDDDPLFHTGG
jgi:hypothetical protein